jgi:hypothetical protein
MPAFLAHRVVTPGTPVPEIDPVRLSRRHQLAGG